MADEKMTQQVKKDEATEKKVANASNAQATPAAPASKPADKPKKTEAVANGVGVRASKRHCMYICSFIKGKSIDAAIADLEKVTKFKKAVPFKGEIPHRKGKGMMSGRYPVNACKIFIPMLKGLKGNAIANGMDLDKTTIVEGVSNWASRPQRRGGVKSKRTHVMLIAREAKK